MSSFCEPKTIHKQFRGKQHQIMKIVKHKSNLRNDLPHQIKYAENLFAFKQITKTWGGVSYK